MAQAQGSKRIYRNRDGADAVVWSIQPSESVIKKNADGSVSSDMRVTAYKTVGSTTTTYDWANGIVLPGHPRPYYSIDGGAWTQCKPLSMDGGDGVMVKAYVGVTKNTLATVKTGIRFKLMHNGVDVAFTPTLPVVRDGANGTSFNIKGTAIGHDTGETDYYAWRSRSDVTAEQRKQPFLVDTYTDSNGYETNCAVLTTPDGTADGKETVAEGHENEAWIVSSDGCLWGYSEDGWVNLGQFKGEPGADGSDGEKGDQGEPGADAVVFELKASVGFLKVERGYTFSNPIQVTGYRTVGSKVTSYDFVRQKVDEPAALAQYCIDGGDWVGCDMLRKGSGSLVMTTYGVGISASTLNSNKPKKYVKFRMTYGGTVVATTPEIQLVGDGISVRGPQMWVNVADGFSFSDRTIGNEWHDVVVHNNVFYSCIQSHAKSSGNEPGTDGGAAYWKATEKQEIVATCLLLAQKALIENLVVGEVETVGSNGCHIHIINGLVRVYGTAGSPNIEFGVDESGMAVMQYYDNAGNLLYDLGPNGIRYISSTPEQWIEFALIRVCDVNGEPCDYSAIWATTGFPNDDTLEPLFRYCSSRLNGVPNDTENDDVVFYGKSHDSGKAEGWYFDSVALTDSDIYMKRANTNIDWYLPVDNDITDANLALLNTSMAKATKIYRRALYKYESGKIAAVQNYYFAV